MIMKKDVERFLALLLLNRISMLSTTVILSALVDIVGL
jgi:hypothetical protein